MLFAKFVDGRHAQQAINTLDGQPFDPELSLGGALMHASMARRELNVSSPYALARVDDQQWGNHHRGGAARGGGYKRDRNEYEESGDINTITVQGLRDKGFTEEDLRGEFKRCHGFETCQMSRIGALFIKFRSAHQAQAALKSEVGRRVGAELARRNLAPDEDSGNKRSRHEHHDEYSGSSRGNGSVTGDGKIDTITVRAYREKGLDEDDVRVQLSKLNGFVTCQTNRKIGAMFIKFETPDYALDALETEIAHEVKAELAKRNLQE